MKTASIFYPHRVFNNGRPCCITFHAKHAAVCSALYTMNVSILVVLIYSWRVHDDAKNPEHLRDVYSGVQIAYVAIIILNVLTICVSMILLHAIHKETYSLIILWLLSTITFTSIEGVCIVYSNVLRDHVNKKFDDWSKREGLIFLMRALLLILPISGVTKFYGSLRHGVVWRKPGTVELRYQLRTGGRWPLMPAVEEEEEEEDQYDIYDCDETRALNPPQNGNNSTDTEYESNSTMV